jgi:3-hydroxyisobutyrate dehydrogenase
MKVGWLGLGAMGRPMAVRAAAEGHVVRGYDVDPRAAEREHPGVEIVDSLAAAAAGAEVLVVMVATPAQAEAVLLGAAGALAATNPGTSVVVTATVGPAAMASLAEAISAAGAVPVDAPVSGGTARAATGELLIMVGADPAAVDTVRPLLETLAASLVVVGPRAGDGQKMKLVNQLLAGVHIAAAAEALALAERLGLDAGVCFDVLRGGAGTSFMFADRGARMVSGDVDDVHSALDIFVKDMGLVTAEAADLGAAVPLATAAQTQFLAGSAAGLGRRDDSSVIEVYRR